jgi:hypothetical protein
MSWVEPKTDWTADDYFNIEDYNRIINNLRDLHKRSVKFVTPYSIESLGDNKDYSSMIYAREINQIENVLSYVNAHTFLFDIGDTTIYKDNGHTPTYEEFNRIESAMAEINNVIERYEQGLRKIPFRLGQFKAIRI